MAVLIIKMVDLIIQMAALIIKMMALIIKIVVPIISMAVLIIKIIVLVKLNNLGEATGHFHCHVLVQDHCADDHCLVNGQKGLFS